VDVALAASAAPTYFPVAEVGDALFADGALYANSPDALALHEAEYFLDQKLKDVALLSVGTTTSQFSFSHSIGRNLGLWSWAREQRLVSVIIASQQNSVNYMMGHRLEERYVRLDVTQSKEQERHLALDVATPAAQKTLRGLAAATMQSASGGTSLKRFLGHTAPRPTFYNLAS
jgi:patatin-like phospholipase/acyl hydrolase